MKRYGYTNALPLHGYVEVESISEEEPMILWLLMLDSGKRLFLKNNSLYIKMDNGLSFWIEHMQKASFCKKYD